MPQHATMNFPIVIRPDIVRNNVIVLSIALLLLLMGMILLVISLFQEIKWGYGAMCGVASVVPFISAWITNQTVLTIYDDKIIWKTGVLFYRRKEIKRCDIRAVEIQDNIISHALGIGDLIFFRQGTEWPAFYMRGVRNPEMVKEIVTKITEDRNRLPPILPHR